jgi:hypothetical protein
MSAVIFHEPAKIHIDSSGNAHWQGRFVGCRSRRACLALKSILTFNWRVLIDLDSPPCHPDAHGHASRSS